MLAGASVGVLALALAVPYYTNNNNNINLDGSTPASIAATRSNTKIDHSPEGVGALVTKLAIMMVCLVVVVARIVTPFSAVRRAQDPFRAADLGGAGGRVVVVL